MLLYSSSKEEPEQPAEPEQPVEEPEQPAEPEQPVEEPEQPAEPEQPVEEPEQPAEPEQPVEEPEQPAEPEQPVEEPETPAEPEQPIEEPEQRVYSGMTYEELVENGLTSEWDNSFVHDGPITKVGLDSRAKASPSFTSVEENEDRKIYHFGDVRVEESMYHDDYPYWVEYDAQNITLIDVLLSICLYIITKKLRGFLTKKH
jgi:hypothetical protein